MPSNPASPPPSTLASRPRPWLPAGLNVVVLAGRLARPPRQRVLPSGDSLVEYEVTVPREGHRAETVPVVWFDAPASGLDHGHDAEVVVLGRVRRRFFRAGGTTGSRTEVVAERVAPLEPARRARSLLAAASASIDQVLGTADELRPRGAGTRGR